jgi:hypothetical protein
MAGQLISGLLRSEPRYPKDQWVVACQAGDKEPVLGGDQ